MRNDGKPCFTKKNAALAIVLALLLILAFGCAKKAVPAPTPMPIPTPTPEPTPTPKPALNTSSLGAYGTGDIKSIVEFADGTEIITSAVGGVDGMTGIFLVTDGNGRLLCECGGLWHFEVVPGSEEYPCTLFLANFDYGVLDSFDKYAYSTFMFEKEEMIFGTYLSKPVSNVVVPQNDFSVDTAWVLWGEYNDTNKDFMVPIDLLNGSKLYAGVAPFTGDEYLFMAELNDLGTHVNSKLSYDPEDPEHIYIQKFLLDENGNETPGNKYSFSLFSKEYELVP